MEFLKVLLYTIDMVPMESQRNDILFSQYNCEKQDQGIFQILNCYLKVKVKVKYKLGRKTGYTEISL